MGDFWYWDRARIISLIIACIYIIMAFFVGETGFWIYVLGYLILPLACIWFGDEMGGYTGFWRGIPLRQTPGGFIRFMGWVLLLLPTVIGIILVIGFDKQ